MSDDSDPQTADGQRASRVDELELSVHHTIGREPLTHTAEYEVHAGFCDLLEVDRKLASVVETVTGVDIRSESIQCPAAIEVVDDVATDGGIDTSTLQLVQGMEGAAIHADTAQADIEIGATDAELRGLLDDLLSYFGGEELAVGDKWRDEGGEGR